MVGWRSKRKGRFPVLFDGNFREIADRGTQPIGKALFRIGVTADKLTASGVVLSVACGVAIATGHLLVGFLLLIAASLPDLLDGPVAKAAGTQSIRGAFFDSVADRVTDSFILGGIAWHLMVTEGGTIAMLPVAVIVVSQLISYQRAKAEIYGFDAKGGLMERAERMIALGIGLALSFILIPVLWLMLVLTLATAMQRFVKVWRQATDTNPVLAARRRESPPIVRDFFQAWNAADERRRRRWREWADSQRQSRRSSRNR